MTARAGGGGGGGGGKNEVAGPATDAAFTETPRTPPGSNLRDFEEITAGVRGGGDGSVRRDPAEVDFLGGAVGVSSGSSSSAK